MSLIRYTSFPVAHLQQHLNHILDQYDSELFGRSEELGGGMFTPAVDVKEDADAYVVQMEVPGVSQDNLNITLQDNVLTIRGHKEQKQEHTEGQFRRVERSYGSFARSLSLPRNVNGNNVTANLHDGVLELRLPKMEEARPRQISVGNTMASGPGTTSEISGRESSPQLEVSSSDTGSSDIGSEGAGNGGTESSAAKSTKARSTSSSASKSGSIRASSSKKGGS